MLPNAKLDSTWLELANEFLPQYEINTPERIAGFFAQGGHESGDFNTLSENLNYSATRLREVFPRYFKTDAAAQAVAHKPEAIANIVYADANRVAKLGNTQPGDGWRFRGRGIFQLTGRWNYEAFAKAVGMTAEQAADYLATPRGAFHSACWFWQSRNLNSFADKQDIRGMSRGVNGGDHGAADRKARFYRCLRALEASVAPARALAVGSRGEDVKAVQRELGTPADGIYGKKTATRVKAWQRSRKLPATGSLSLEQVNMILS